MSVIFSSDSSVPANAGARRRTQPPTIALVETRWVGHHPTFFREFVASLRRIGVRVLALCPQPNALAADPGVQAAALEVPHGSLLLKNRDHDPLTTLWRWYRAGRTLDALEDRTGWRAEAVFFTYLDNFVRFLPIPGAPSLLLGRPWTGLYFRNDHLAWSRRGPVNRLKHLAKGDGIFRSGSLHAPLTVLDERFDEPLRAISGRTIRHFPDITDETAPSAPTAEATGLKRLAAGRPIVGMAGGLEKRKGLLTFVRTAAAARAAGRPWFFAAKGPMLHQTFSPAELAWLRETVPTLTDVLHLDVESTARINDGADYNALVQAFDVMWVAYEEFNGSSNTLTKAALFEKPVLATAGECIGSRVENFGLGLTIAEGSVPEALDGIGALLKGQGRDGRSLQPQWAEYRSLHTRAHLDRCFQEIVDGLR